MEYKSAFLGRTLRTTRGVRGLCRTNSTYCSCKHVDTQVSTGAEGADKRCGDEGADKSCGRRDDVQNGVIGDDGAGAEFGDEGARSGDEGEGSDV